LDFAERRLKVMSKLQIFNNSEFGEIRTVTIDNEPMFCLADVCKALEITNVGNVRQRLSEKGIHTADTPTNGGIQKMVFISESNLYKTIFQSRKESAERFTDWVTSEVLPTIRKTGSYSVPQTTAGQIQLLAKGHMELEQKIDDVNKDLQDFKQDMPLLAVECEKITRAVKTKGIDILGGKTSNAYSDNSIRSKVYQDIHNEVKRQFGVNTYKAIKRSQCDKAIEIINNYTLPMALANEVEQINAQMRIM
jgi:prophage antirepressor-like protein